MSNGNDLSNVIRRNAEKPTQVSVDNVNVTQHNLRDLIEADRYLIMKTEIEKPKRGLRFNKLVPPGTT